MSVNPRTPGLSVEMMPRAITELQRMGACPSRVVHLSVAGGGCCGPVYTLALAKPDGAGTRIAKDFGAVQLVVDPEDLTSCSGVTIDYVEEGDAKGFLVERPAANSCGCGGHG